MLHFIRFLAPALLLAAVLPAHASECTRLGFSVNDYGKEGPARDAQALLDKYIKSEMDKRGVKSYRTGPKTVTCKLFLDFGFFDEYTCTAAASVCWGEGAVTNTGVASAGAKKLLKPKPAR